MNSQDLDYIHAATDLLVRLVKASLLELNKSSDGEARRRFGAKADRIIRKYYADLERQADRDGSADKALLRRPRLRLVVDKGRPVEAVAAQEPTPVTALLDALARESDGNSDIERFTDRYGHLAEAIVNHALDEVNAIEKYLDALDESILAIFKRVPGPS